MKLPPPARETPFIAILEKYRASHAGVFAKHQWQDEFAPPACVKPIKPLPVSPSPIVPAPGP